MTQFGCDPQLNIRGCFPNTVTTPLLLISMLGGLLGTGIISFVALRWKTHPQLRTSIIVSSISIFTLFIHNLLSIFEVPAHILLISLVVAGRGFLAAIFLTVGSSASIALASVQMRQTLTRRLIEYLNHRVFKILVVVTFPCLHAVVTIAGTFAFMAKYPEQETLVLRYASIYYRSIFIVEQLAALASLVIAIVGCKKAIDEYTRVRKALQHISAAPKMMSESPVHADLKTRMEPKVKMYLVLALSVGLSFTCMSVIFATAFDIAYTFMFDEQPLYTVPSLMVIRLAPGYASFIGVALCRAILEGKIVGKRFTSSANDASFKSAIVARSTLAPTDSSLGNTV